MSSCIVITTESDGCYHIATGRPGGLCSPGRWPIDRRIIPDYPILRDVRDTVFESFKKCIPSFDRGCPRQGLYRVACGQCTPSPFKKEDIENARYVLRKTLARHGFGPGTPEPEDRPQHFELRLLGELAKACADPDMGFFSVCASGGLGWVHGPPLAEVAGHLREEDQVEAGRLGSSIST